MKRVALILAFLFSVGLSFGQTVCVGSTEECREAQKKICASEHVANIDLSGIRHLHGSFHDQTGAVFSEKYSVVLRDPSTGHILRSVALNSEGQYRFDGLSYEHMNLILVLMRDGKPAWTGFESPVRLHCDKSEDCALEIVLRAAPTDQTKYQCPLS